MRFLEFFLVFFLILSIPNTIATEYYITDSYCVNSTDKRTYVDIIEDGDIIKNNTVTTCAYGCFGGQCAPVTTEGNDFAFYLFFIGSLISLAVSFIMNKLVKNENVNANITLMFVCFSMCFLGTGGLAVCASGVIVGSMLPVVSSFSYALFILSFLFIALIMIEIIKLLRMRPYSKK